MSAYDSDDQSAPSRHTPMRKPILVSGSWLRSGVVALSVEAAALIMLATGAAAPWIAIATAIVAGAYARWAWHRARTALDAENAAAR